MDFQPDFVTHPSQFPTDELQKVDRSFRCTICKDIYDAPVSLHCGHTFCSLCIRSSLPHKPECPVCRSQAKEAQLVRNVMFDEAITAWKAARASVLQHATAAVSQTVTGKKRLLSDELHEQNGSGNRPQKSRKRETVMDVTDTAGNDTTTDTNAPVPCPICTQKVRLSLVDSHIESGCESHIFTNESSKSASKAAWAYLFKNKAPSLEETQIPTKRLPKVSYGTFNLSGLRRLLSEKGLPSTGDKDELITRHERWIALYNANLDRTNPITVGELKLQLKELEANTSNASPPTISDEKEWTKRHDAHFKALIEAARQKKNDQKKNVSSRTPGMSGVSSSQTEEWAEKDARTSDVVVIE